MSRSALVCTVRGNSCVNAKAREPIQEARMCFLYQTILQRLNLQSVFFFLLKKSIKCISFLKPQKPKPLSIYEVTTMVRVSLWLGFGLEFGLDLQTFIPRVVKFSNLIASEGIG